VVTETDLRLGVRRTLHVYDTGAPPGGTSPTSPGGTSQAGGGLAVFWHHGTPNTGAPPAPLFPAAAERGIRWVSYDRPGYGGSSPDPGRDVASAAADTAAVADALGIGRFAVMGHSGGGPHALACAALLPGRVLGTASLAGLAPYRAEGLDWFAGMSPAGVTLLTAAAAGPAALQEHLASSEFDPEQLTPADYAALAGDWAWLGEVAGKAIAAGPGGMPDDELAYVAPWGFDPGQIRPPVLLVHGGQDRIAPCAHSQWLARQSRRAQLWLRPDDGHISVLDCAVPALDWLVEQAGRH